MVNIAPSNLVLRCYGYQIGNKPWIGICLNFNLAVEAESRKELKEKMYEVIISYLEVVFDTSDKDSIPNLLARRAPIKDWFIYSLIKVAVFFSHLPEKFVIFKQAIPIHLPHSC